MPNLHHKKDSQKLGVTLYAVHPTLRNRPLVCQYFYHFEKIMNKQGLMVNVYWLDDNSEVKKIL